VATTRRNTSQRLTLVILLLASVTAVTLDYRGSVSHGVDHVRNGALDAIAPIQRVLSGALRPIGDFFAGAVNYGSAVSDNRRLQAELGALRRQVLQNQAAAQQLQQILDEQHLPFVANIPTVLAEVISGSASNFLQTIEIDRGTSSGVGAQMPVVAGPGLLGLVLSAGRSTSVVQLITDPHSSFGVRFGTTTWVAVANGQGAGNALTLSGVTASMQPKKGQVVYTSGLTGAAYPAGIPIGTVSAVHYAGGSLTKTVLVEPLANLEGVGYVSVMQWFPAP
jgi:rod shape-determining protein MreC